MVLWSIAKRLSYIEDARCLKVKNNLLIYVKVAPSCLVFCGSPTKMSYLPR